MAYSICNQCGAEVEEDFAKLCQEGCPICGSQRNEIYSKKPEEE